MSQKVPDVNTELIFKGTWKNEENMWPKPKWIQFGCVQFYCPTVSYQRRDI